MALRNTILDALKNDLETYIQSSSPNYNTDVGEVKRGIFMFEDIINKPAICFWCYKDEIENEFGGDGTRWLWIYLYGYCDTDGENGVDDIHNLVADVEYFLYNDFTYTDDTEIGDIIIYEGGTQDPAALFQLEMRIKYDYTY